MQFLNNIIMELECTQHFKGSYVNTDKLHMDLIGKCNHVKFFMEITRCSCERQETAPTYTSNREDCGK